MEILCPLCEGTTDTLYSEIADRKYYKCPLCDGVFMGSDFLPNRTEEIDRYMEHNNDVYDERYRNFVNPNTIMRSYEYLKSIEVIYDKRGVGFFIAPKAKRIVKNIYKEDFIEKEVPTLIKKMKLLDIEIDDLKKRLQDSWEKE